AEAVRLGMLRAFDEGCEVTGYWDADLATSLDEVPRLLNVLRASDEVLVAMGSRVRLMGTSIQRNPLRHYAGRSFATVASSMLGMSVYDTQCGAKLLRTCDPVRQALQSPFVSRWIFDVQLLARVVIHAGSSEVIREVPVHAWEDVAGSKLRPIHVASALLELRKMRGELGQARRISQVARAKTISDTPSGRSR
ncbi:MAG: dolichyl-phosphate beta-glucosyltransferase, partial [Kiritimatiellia bacterium]